jgi:myo-inositol-1(or 4)-monophosphatase
LHRGSRALSGRPAPARSDDVELALAAARIAGEIALGTFGSAHDVIMKAPGQPLTQTDLEIDRMLREVLLAARPGYGWLSEETADAPDRLHSARVWIVDPIDGTRSFIEGKPEFTVSIGLAEEGRPVVGVIYNPVRREMYHASHGRGAWLDRGATRVPLRVRTAAPSPRRALVSSSDLAAGRIARLGEGWQAEAVGSTAYKLALVAAGEADAFVTPSWRSEWDVCAGVVILTEAGGTVTDLAGRTHSFNLPRPELRGIIAASGLWGDRLRARFDPPEAAGAAASGKD